MAKKEQSEVKIIVVIESENNALRIDVEHGNVEIVLLHDGLTSHCLKPGDSYVLHFRNAE